jgi:hypothetical protein
VAKQIIINLGTITIGAIISGILAASVALWSASGQIAVAKTAIDDNVARIQRLENNMNTLDNRLSRIEGKIDIISGKIGANHNGN